MKFHKSLLTLGAAVAVGSLATVAVPSAARAGTSMSGTSSPCSGSMKSGKCSGVKQSKAANKTSAGKCAGTMQKGKCAGK